MPLKIFCFLSCVKAVFAVTATVSAFAGVFEIQDDGSVIERTKTLDVAWVVPNSSAPSMTVAPQMPAGWGAAVNAVSAKYDLSPALLEALIWQESRWRTHAVSPVGARGLTQLMPETARALGVNANDPLANLEGGARYLRFQLNRFDGNLDQALAAYNAGPGRVIKAGGVPAIAETQNYVKAIMGRLATRSFAAQ